MYFLSTIISVLSLLVMVAIPIMLIFTTKWIFQLKKNSEIQIEQNREIIALLKQEDSED